MDYAQLLGFQDSPAPPAPPPEVVQPQAATPEGAGAGFSYQAFSPEKYEQIQRGPGTKLDKQMATDRAQVEQSVDPLVQKLQEATNVAVEAETRRSEAEAKRIGVESEGRAAVAKANQEFLTNEQAAAANAQAESVANMAQYKASLMEYAAAKVNPSQLWESSGTGGQVAMLVTAFAHDFLGAKGIKTSGLESIKTAINNNINAQLENMRKKLDVAQGFKSLWEMQRLQSSSDAEARARMRGFYLNSLTNEIDAKLGQYDSQLALIKGQAAKAELLKEQAKNDLIVQKHIEDSSNQRAQRRVQVYVADLSAATARVSAEATIKAAQIKAQAEADKDKVGRLISDPSRSGGNKVVREFLPGTPPETMTKFREQNAKVLNTVGMIQRLVELQDQIDHTVPTGDIAALNRLKSESQRVAESVRNLVKMGIIYDSSGKQINEQEMEIYEQIVGKKDWWLNGDNVRQFGELAGNLRHKNDMVMNAISTQLTPDDPYFGKSLGWTEFDPANKALTDIQRQPGGGKVKSTEVDALVQDAVKPDAAEPAFDKGLLGRDIDDAVTPASNDQKKVEKAFEDFKKDQGGVIQTSNPQVRIPIDTEAPTKSFLAIENLAELATKGDESAKKELTRLAKPTPTDDKNELLLQSYAAWQKATRKL